MMRVVYYTRPSFLDPALSMIAEVSRKVELHVLLEFVAGSAPAGLLDEPPAAVGSGLVPADPAEVLDIPRRRTCCAS